MTHPAEFLDAAFKSVHIRPDLLVSSRCDGFGRIQRSNNKTDYDKIVLNLCLELKVCDDVGKKHRDGTDDTDSGIYEDVNDRQNKEEIEEEVDPCAFKHSVFKAVHVLENRDLLHGSHVPEMSRKVIPEFLVF